MTTDDFQSFPSMPTIRAGDPDALGRIDQYDLVRKLGGGGFGVVYLARDTVSGIDVALKTLHPLLKSNPEEMEALRAKFALVSRLSHPNIASALVLHPCQRVDVWDESVRRELRLVPGDFIMVMRYAPGVTLSKWRRQFANGVVPLPLALEIAGQIAAALDYAHGEHIVHRDIKPANIMVETLGEASQPRSNRQMVSSSNSPCADHQTIGPSDHPTKIRVRILDFGLAAEIRSSMSRVSTETGDTSGTRPYMAPEQWLGRKQDGRTDQYALACVLYELLSGEPPFAGVFETGDPVIMKDAVVRDAPEEIEGVPAQVNAALLKALAKNPKERFASCAEFVESCLGPQRTQSPQRESHTEAQRHGGAEQGGENLVRHASSVSDAQDAHRPNSARPEVSPHRAEPRKKSGKGWLVAALGAAAVAAAAWFVFPRNGGASSPSEPQPVEARAPSSATQNDAAEYERRIAEERKAREDAERKAEAERNARQEVERREREAKAAAEKAEAERKARQEAERRKREHGGVQLWAGGPYWAETNIGADKPEDYGLYFWWGDTIGYRSEGDAWVASDGSTQHFSFSYWKTPTHGKGDATLRRKGWTTSAGVLAPEHDAAHVHWGGNWRMPTKQEFGDLVSKCDWTKTTMNGVKGYVVRGRGAYADASIFLPAAGLGGGTSLSGAGLGGNYWSSVPNSGSNYSWGLSFSSGYPGSNTSYFRSSGQSVRPVLEVAE